MFDKEVVMRDGRRIWIAAGLLIVVFVLVLSMMVLILGKTSEVQAKENTRISYESVRIEEGDSLWTIALEYQTTGQKTGETVRRIAKLNGIKTDTKLVAGCYLLVPVTVAIS